MHVLSKSLPQKSGSEELGRNIIIQKSDVVIHSGAEYYKKRKKTEGFVETNSCFFINK